VQIEIKPKSQLEFIPQDNEESEFLDLVDFGDAAFLVEIFIPHMNPHTLCVAFTQAYTMTGRLAG